MKVLEEKKIQYKKIVKSALTEEIDAKYMHISTGDRSALNKYIEKCNSNQLVKLEDYVKFRGSIEEDFINESLSDWINDFVKVKPYAREYTIAQWKHNVRKVAVVASGYIKIDKLINEVLLSFEKIDKALITAYNLEIDNKDKFALIKKDVDDISLLVNKFNKNVNNVISKSIKKINQTFYYYEETGKMINLFVEAYGIIGDDKFGLQKNNSLNNIDAILRKLSVLLNSIDENENRVFTKSNIETRIFAFYNRVIGYRNTSRGIAMLHSIIELLIKKMVAMKSKTSTLKISEQKYSAHDLNNQTPSPIHAAKI